LTFLGSPPFTSIQAAAFIHSHGNTDQNFIQHYFLDQCTINMSTHKEEVLLSAPEHWDDWDREFCSKAIDSGLWGFINPNEEPEPLLQRPVRPEFNMFPAASDDTAATTTATSSSATALTPQGDDESSQTVQPTQAHHVKATSYLDLDPRYQTVFHHMMSTYHQDLNHYTAQQRDLQALRSWVSKTVDVDFRKATCEPTKSIREWYKELRDLVRLDQDRVLSISMQAYNKAIIPLTTAPKDFLGWLKAWTSAMADLKAHKSTIAEDRHLWLDSFLKAIRQVRPQWESVYSLEYRKRAATGTLNYLQVANDFRDEISKDLLSQPRRNRKGTFVGGKETPKSGEKRKQEDQATSSRNPNKRQKASKKKTQTTTLSSCLCERPGCNMEKCWFVHPELAPAGYTLSAKHLATVEQNRRKLTDGEQITVKQEKKPEASSVTRVHDLETDTQD
jgi:hypothetical protein